MDDFADRPYRIVIDDWERVIDAPCAADAFRGAAGKWAEEKDVEVIWCNATPVTVSHSGRPRDNQTLVDYSIDHYEYDFAIDGGDRFRVHVYDDTPEG